MKFYKNLYVSESLEKKRDKIINKLIYGKYPLTVYVIVLLEEGENQMEFYSASMFKQKIVSADNIFVVGIASGYDEAIYLVQRIAEEVYEKTGGLDMRSYIREQERRNLSVNS